MKKEAFKRLISSYHEGGELVLASKRVVKFCRCAVGQMLVVRLESRFKHTQATEYIDSVQIIDQNGFVINEVPMRDVRAIRKLKVTADGMPKYMPVTRSDWLDNPMSSHT